MSKELTFSAPVELTDSEIDAVTGGCVIGDNGIAALKDQAAFFGNDPLPPNWQGATGLFGHAAGATDCLCIFLGTC